VTHYTRALRCTLESTRAFEKRLPLSGQTLSRKRPVQYLPPQGKKEKKGCSVWADTQQETTSPLSSSTRKKRKKGCLCLGRHSAGNDQSTIFLHTCCSVSGSGFGFEGFEFWGIWFGKSVCMKGLSFIFLHISFRVEELGCRMLVSGVGCWC